MRNAVVIKSSKAGMTVILDDSLPFDELWEIFITGKPTNAAANRRKTLVECGEDPRGARPVTYVDQLMGAICETGGVSL